MLSEIDEQCHEDPSIAKHRVTGEVAGQEAAAASAREQKG